MSKTLKLKFSNESGKSLSMNVPYIGDKVTADEVKTLGTDIISKGVFTVNGEALKKLSSAAIVDTEKTDMLQ
ncbi:MULTISPECIES: DUF2922 domain-containing protein [Clostridium]|uniref:DUF2922 domain-containing protein n=1 Tax=Clostridium TaxID=1485 RepID=UPI0008251FF0|nr:MULTISPECIES: DUF2922 domain-containing protein [Clostridium]PJI10545.1 DUF2922 domain-containing protein [Clostridium sp. CT7]